MNLKRPSPIRGLLQHLHLDPMSTIPFRLVERIQNTYYKQLDSAAWTSTLRCAHCNYPYDFLHERHYKTTRMPEPSCRTVPHDRSRNAELETARRTRQLQTRKRSASMDGKWRRPRLSLQEASPLFGMLPAEVRMMVYRAVLCAGESVSFYRTRREGDEVLRVLAVEPCSGQLLRTCRRVYREAMELLYVENNFHFDQLAELLTFVRWIPEPRLHQIRSVTLSNTMALRYGAMFYGLYSRFDLYALLPSMTGLKEILYVVEMDKVRDEWFPVTTTQNLRELKMQEGCAVYYEIRVKEVDWTWNVAEGTHELTRFGGWRINERVRLV